MLSRLDPAQVCQALEARDWLGYILTEILWGNICSALRLHYHNIGLEDKTWA